MNASSRQNWIAVASADHARRGRDEMTPGFMQVCHGKLAPIKRVLPGDLVAYYAPTVTMGGKEKSQSFISFGIVEPGAPYAFDMGGEIPNFMPFRRNVRYLDAVETPITPLLDAFEFVEDRSRWGYKFRFGLFSISDHDMALIAQAMQANTDLL
ncbi:MAG: EVE domain-containing protein, partial [Burkholderiaceae bacterium]